ncbi:MAG: IS1634 family transposase [Prevotella sp.]
MNYKLTITRSKNAKCFYIQTTYRKRDGRLSSKTIKKLGNETFIKENYGVEDAEVWAREELERMRQAAREEKQGLIVELHPDRLIDGSERIFNGGDIFIEQIMSRLGLREICKQTAESHRIKFDLGDYLTRMVCSRILHPGSKLADFLNGSRFIERKDLKLENFYRALDVIGNDMNDMQGAIYRRSAETIGRNTGVIYYDCTNVFFETETDDEFRKYGHSKENRPNPLVQIGMFMDMDGLPLGMCVNPGNTSEQKTLQPLEEVLAEKFGLSRFVVCTDGGLGSRNNRRYNVTEDRNFITVQSLKKLSAYYQDWAISPEGWHLRPRLRDDEHTRCLHTYNLDKIDLDQYLEDTFYKECLTDETAFEEHLIVTYSRKYDLYQKQLRAQQIQRAITKINRGEIKRPKSPNDCRRFMKDTYFDSKGNPLEVITSAVLDMEQIEAEARFDGFNALVTSLDDDPCTIIRVNSWRWEIEECFRVEKSDLDMRPVYVRAPQRIAAHFFICFIALLILKIMQKQHNGQFPIGQIRKTLSEMNLTKLEGIGYIPSFNSTPLTTAIQETAKIHIDRQINTPAQIRADYRVARKC